MPGDETQTLSFVIPCRDDAPRLARCLASIAENEWPAERVQVIVVDNGSVDGSPEIARHRGATVIRLPDLKVGELRNRGATMARGEILAFVDADHEIGPGWIRAAGEALADPSVGAAGSLCHSPEDGTWVQRAYDLLRRHTRGRRDVEWLGTGNLAVSRSAFEMVRGFDSSLDTCEDVDLCFRLRSAGYRIVEDDRFWNVHHGDPPTLSRLFRGELWRGRDNLRVTLKGPLSLTGVAGIAIPILDLGSLALLAAAPLLLPSPGLLMAAVGVTVPVGLSALRAAWMLLRSQRRNLAELGHAFLVGFVYDLARALALVVRGGHHRTRTTQVADERR